MFRFRVSRDIPRPAEDIWKVLIDFTNVPKWERGPIEVRQTSPGPPGVGTRITALRDFGGRVSTLHGVITDWQEGRSATMSLAGGPLRESRATYSVEPMGPNSSTVTYATEAQLVGVLRILTPLMPLLGRAVARNNLRRLEEYLASRA
jgi:hypothetical protein